MRPELTVVRKDCYYIPRTHEYRSHTVFDCSPLLRHYVVACCRFYASWRAADSVNSEYLSILLTNDYEIPCAPRRGFS